MNSHKIFTTYKNCLQQLFFKELFVMNNRQDINFFFFN